MAVTKTHPIKSTLKAAINEILISGLEAWLNNNNTSSMYD